jgi:very-short-patch-repair endonuclease
MSRLNPLLKTRARKLRSNMTDAEQKLWHALRSKQISQARFRRQHPLGPYIADFACIEKKLIIELDGG